MILKLVNIDDIPTPKLYTYTIVAGVPTEVDGPIPDSGDISIIKNYLINCEISRNIREVIVSDLIGDNEGYLEIPASDNERPNKEFSQFIALPVYVPIDQGHIPYDGDVDRLPDGREGEDDVKGAVISINTLLNS